MTITILDGSLGQELVHRSGKQPTPFWSTSVMLETPTLVGELHRDYLVAGAEIITTNTYALLPDRLQGSGFENRFAELATTALAQATSARLEHGSGKILGSLGPLGASYRSDFDHSKQDAERLYGPLVSILATGVDIFCAETVSSIQQLENVVHVLTSMTKHPIWIALSTMDEDGSKLRSGEDLKRAAPYLQHDQIEAVLINCTRPEVVNEGLTILKDLSKPFGAYANGFTKIETAFLEDKPTVEALKARTDLDPMGYADFAEIWVKNGATIIGGCCEVGPKHVQELARRFK